MISLKGEDHGTHPQEIQYRTGQGIASFFNMRKELISIASVKLGGFEKHPYSAKVMFSLRLYFIFLMDILTSMASRPTTDMSTMA